MEKNEQGTYFAIVRKWWWVIGLLFVATVGTMLTLYLISEPQYQASVTLQVSAPPPQEVPLYSTIGRQALSDEIARTQTSLQELLSEGDVAYRVLRDLPDIPMKGGDLK